MTISTLGRAALTLATAGWRVFPCEPGGKRPLGALAPHGCLDASAEPEVVAAWWSAQPAANIGLALAGSGVSVIDIDPAGFDAPEVSALAEHPTYTVRTPRDGRHLYYRGDLPNSVGRLAAGIDTRGAGGYVLAPPSVVSGRAYEVLEEEAIAEVPGWVRAKVHRSTDTAPADPAPYTPDDPVNVARAEAWLRAHPAPPVGAGANDAIYRAAARLRDLGLGEATAAPLLEAWCGQLDRWREAVANAYAYAQNVPGARATASAAETFGAAVHAEPADGQSARFAQAWQPLGSLLTTPPEPVAEVIEGLVERGCLNLLSAPGDSFKSWCALQMAVSVALGRRLWGRAVEQCPVWHLSYEDSAHEIGRRLHSLMAGIRPGSAWAGSVGEKGERGEGGKADGLADLALPPGAVFLDARSIGAGPLLHIDAAGVVTRGDGMDYLEAQRERTAGHAFVVLDSAYNVLRFAERARLNEDAVNAAVAMLDRMCAGMDLTMLALYHPTRAGAQRGDAGNSTAFDSAPRVRLGLRREEGGSNSVTLVVEKRNHAARGKPISLQWHAGVLVAAGSGDSTGERGSHGDRQRASTLDEAVVAVASMAAAHGAPLRQRGPVEGWVLTEIHQRTGQPAGRRQIAEALARAVATGRLHYQRGGGNGAREGQSAGYYPAEIA